MRLLAWIAAALALIATPANAVYTGAGLCASTNDLGSNAWIEEPHGSQSGYQLWTPTRVARAGSGVVVTIDTDDTTSGYTGSALSPDIPSQTSTSFALHFQDGRSVMSWENLLTWVQEVRRIAASEGLTAPKIYAHIRSDLLSRQELSRTGAWAITSSMILRSDRTVSAFAAAFRDNGAFAENGSNSPSNHCQSSGSVYDACGLTLCRSGYDAATVNLDDIYPWSGSETTGCGRAYNGSGSRQRGSTVYDLAATILGGSAENVAFYFQRPGAADKVFSIGIAALANELDSGYRAIEVARSQAMVTAGFDGVYISHKNHQFSDGVTNAAVQWWPKIDGDGLGGFGAGTSATLNEFAIGTDPAGGVDKTPFTGPPEMPDGTAWDWAHRSDGDLKIHQDHDTAGVPVMMLVTPGWYVGCPQPASTSPADVATAWAQWDSYSDDAACTDAKWGTTETPRLREMVARADIVLIDLGGKDPLGDIGSGSSGWTYPKLKAMLEAVASPDGTPPKVLGYLGHPYGAGDNATPPKLCANPSETNPVKLVPCGNGVVNAGEGCDDGNTSNGDGCSSTCTVE